MLELKFVRENPDLVKADLKKRNLKDLIKQVDELLKKDAEWRGIKQRLDELRHKRNAAAQEINRLKKEGKNFSAIVKEVKKIPGQIKEVEAKEQKLKERMTQILSVIPNVLHESVPEGRDDADNVEVRKWGDTKKPKFDLKIHGRLVEDLGIADFDHAAKVAGSGFFFLKGELALLDTALQRFALELLLKKGFEPVVPPYMLHRRALSALVSLEDFENMMYKVEGEDLYMIATSEHPLIAMHAGDTLNESQLPLRYAGISPCFRKEIGSHGVDTRGLFRTHQFNKIEQVVFCKAEDSWDLFEEIQKNSELILQKLRLPYRVVSICSGAIGQIKAKQYDIEAWFPREEKYAEVTSCSNCTTYQAVSLNIRFQRGTEREFVHILNNTGLATSRTMRAILENFQNKDGTVTVPAALKSYMGGLNKITGKSKDGRE